MYCRPSSAWLCQRVARVTLSSQCAGLLTPSGVDRGRNSQAKGCSSRKKAANERKEQKGHEVEASELEHHFGKELGVTGEIVVSIWKSARESWVYEGIALQYRRA